MDKIRIMQVEMAGGIIAEHVIIDKGNGEFTSMLKSIYDELEAQREQSGKL